MKQLDHTVSRKEIYENERRKQINVATENLESKKIDKFRTAIEKRFEREQDRKRENVNLDHAVSRKELYDNQRGI